MEDKNSAELHHSYHHEGIREFDPSHLLSTEELRKTFMPPEDILGDFLTSKHENMVDLGCGAGYFTIPAASKLPQGIVYAIDRQQNMIDITLERAAQQGLSNIRGIVASATNIPLENHKIDALLMSMMFHDVPEQDTMLSEAKRILKQEGILYMVEWDQVESDFGPPMNIRIRPGALTNTLEEAGFTVQHMHHAAKNGAVYFVYAVSPKN